MDPNINHQGMQYEVSGDGVPTLAISWTLPYFAVEGPMTAFKLATKLVKLLRLSVPYRYANKPVKVAKDNARVPVHHPDGRGTGRCWIGCLGNVEKEEEAFVGAGK